MQIQKYLPKHPLNMRLIKHFLPLIAFSLILAFSQNLNAQGKPSKTEKALAKQAYLKLDLEQYKEAIEDYQQLLRMKPNHPQYNFEIGVAYLRSPKEFPLAAQYFEKALKYSTTDTIEELFYYMGKAYQNNHDFEKAKESYQNFDRFIKPTKSGAGLKAEVDWLKKTCNHGEYHVKLNTKNPLENRSKPVNNVKKYFLNATDYVIMINLGNKINSVHDDEGAVFFNKEKEIFYTSKRNPFANPNEFTYGKDFEQIYVSKKDGDDWKSPEIISALNLFKGDFADASSQVSIVAVNKDENHMILYKNEVLYETKKTDASWSEPEAFGNNINLSKSEEPSACLSDDGKTLIIVSDKIGGYGKRDMYTCKKDENGEWGELVNMGSVLNTEQDEDTPFLIDNDLLYFSSKGHSSIGGYDVFFSKFDGTKWGNPQSLGIPINTPQDEISYIRSKLDVNTAYYASSRVDGFGYKDIYKISSYYRTKKRDDLPSIAMTDFLSDELKKKQLEEEKKKAEKEEAEVVVADIPVKEEKKVEVKETPLPPVNEDLFKDILFSFNGNKLTPESIEQVRKIAEYMKKNPDFVIALSGHADYLGTDAVNDKISRERALIVTNLLVKDGVDPYHVNYAYYGEKKPKASGTNSDGSDNPDGRAKNRRVEFNLGQNKMFRVVTFASNSSTLSATELSTLSNVADFMKGNNISKVTLSGYSDSVGNADYNKVLSERRVIAAKNELLKLGISDTRINTEFFGEERPSAPGTNGRRVEIKVQ